LNLVSLFQNETEVSCHPKSSTINKTMLGLLILFELLQEWNKKRVKTKNNLIIDILTIYKNEKKHIC